jgi:hypothetical protein
MSFTYLGCKESCFESSASAVVSVDLTCCTTFILLIELEQDIKITIRARTDEIFFLKGSHRIG